MPRFSIKELFQATTRVAIGLGTLVFLFTFGDRIGRELGELSPLLFLLLWLGGVGFIGAGLLTPFTRPYLGAMIGIISWFVMCALMFVFLVD